ncbi:MAG: hypothetical protein U0073_06880 [Bacteroidia bacterium]
MVENVVKFNKQIGHIRNSTSTSLLMSKPVTQDLFLLIKSLSKNEKGYIRKFAFRQGEEDSKLIKLFLAIDKQEVYDEGQLIRTEKYIRQLPRMKIYLYEKILDSLDNYFSGNNALIQVRKILNRVSILFDKGFYDACIKQLYKAKELARRYEFFSQLLEALEWERTLMLEKQLTGSFEAVAREESEVLNQLKLLSFYSSTYDEMAKLYSETIWIRSENDHRKYKSLIEKPLIQKPAAHLSLRSSIIRLKTLAKYYSALDDRKMYMKLAKKTVSMMEAKEGYIHQHLLQYIKVLNNLIVTLGENNQFDDFNFSLEKMSTLGDYYPAARSGKMQSMIRMRVITRRFYQHLHLREYNKALSLVPEFEDCISQYRHLISTLHLQMFLYALANIHFITENYKRALVWINKILNESETPETKVFQGYARLLNIIIHYELHNEDLLESLIPSATRFFSKKPDVYQLEKLFIDTLKKKLLTTGSASEKRKAFEELKYTIQTKFNPNDNRIMEYFDFISWIDSKTAAKSYQEMLKKGF